MPPDPESAGTDRLDDFKHDRRREVVEDRKDRCGSMQ
jgi:hypothetical protein